ncbi:MAG TPA: hypothetical protein VFJ58_19800 [Armatimonadota bacterium]|nr:hypothetical protein [Armatimonadota bacterium]
MKRLIFLIAGAALITAPAFATESGGHYDYPCSYPIGAFTAATEFCSCNGNKPMAFMRQRPGSFTMLTA